MKSELQIAEENIKKYKDVIELWGARNEDSDSYFDLIENTTETHKASCERFLEFLEKEFVLKENKKRIFRRESIEGVFGNLEQFKRIKKKYNDLKQAISLYEKEGI